MTCAATILLVYLELICLNNLGHCPAPAPILFFDSTMWQTTSGFFFYENISLSFLWVLVSTVSIHLIYHNNLCFHFPSSFFSLLYISTMRTKKVPLGNARYAVWFIIIHFMPKLQMLLKDATDCRRLFDAKQSFVLKSQALILPAPKQFLMSPNTNIKGTTPHWMGAKRTQQGRPITLHCSGGLMSHEKVGSQLVFLIY